MIYCLCKLHNYCINEKENLPKPSCLDEAYITLRGGITLNEDERPEQLLDGGDHRDDMDRWNIRGIANEVRDVSTPRDVMLKIVLDKDIGRPGARGR